MVNITYDMELSNIKFRSKANNGFVLNCLIRFMEGLR